MKDVMMRHVEGRQMAFHKVGPSEATTLWPEVYDPQTKIRIEYTTRDMPKNPLQMRVMIRRSKSLIFTFDVVVGTVKHDDAPGFTTTYTGSLEKFLQGFRQEKRAFPDFNSEGEFLTYVLKGAEMLFTEERLIASGAKYIFRLT